MIGHLAPAVNRPDSVGPPVLRDPPQFSVPVSVEILTPVRSTGPGMPCSAVLSSRSANEARRLRRGAPQLPDAEGALPL